MPLFRVRYTGPLSADYEADDQFDAEQAFIESNQDKVACEELDENGKSFSDYEDEEAAKEFFNE